MGVWYATREDVTSVPDIKQSANMFAVVDRAIESSSRSVEGLLRRRFYPWTGTRYFTWPPTGRSPSWRLRLGADELVSLTALSSGGSVISASDYFLEPVNDGPPYDTVEIDRASTASFTAGDTSQRNIAMTGVWYWPDSGDSAGTLAAAISSAGTTAVTVSNSAVIGVGQIIKVDNERMIVTDKTMTDVVALSANLTASAANNQVLVEDGTAFSAGEIVRIGAERMRVNEISGNTLLVTRAVEGSVLAAHTGNTDTVYAPRILTVERGALGTTAATHSNGATVTKHVAPGLVRELTVAETIVQLSQGSAGYARTVGSGDNLRESSGRGLQQIRDAAYLRYGRKARTRAV